MTFTCCISNIKLRYVLLVISRFWKKTLFNCQTECLRSIQRICLITIWIFFQFFNPDTFGLHFWAVILLLKINIIACWLVERSTRYTTIIEGNFVRLKTNNMCTVCYNILSSQFQSNKQLVRVNLSENWFQTESSSYTSHLPVCSFYGPRQNLKYSSFPRMIKPMFFKFPQFISFFLC